MTTEVPPADLPEEGDEGSTESGSIPYDELTPGEKLDLRLAELRDTVDEIVDTVGAYASAVIDQIQAKASALSAAIDEVQERAAAFSAAVDEAQAEADG